MSVWIQGTIEGSYIGTRARVKSDSPLADLVPYDIRLYRATIGAIERISDPDAAPAPPQAPTALPPPPDGTTTLAPDAAASTPPAPPPPDPNVSPTAAPDATVRVAAHPSLAPTLPPKAGPVAPPNELRQAELHDVNYVGAGATEFQEHHTAYDLRLDDVELTSSVEIDGRIYGRLTANVVASLFPTDEMKARALRERIEQKKREKKTGAWVEGIRWVLIIGGAWLTFGLCGTLACLLWLGVTVFSVVARALLRSLVPATPAVRVLGWALVLAGGGLAWLLYHRVTTVQCMSANWWLIGIALTVVVSSILYSRYAFLCTKVVWLATLLSLCYASRTHRCSTTEKRPSVVDQGPRTDADGHWPKDPQITAPPLDGMETREAAVRMSVAQAILERDALWKAPVPIVVHVPLARIFDAQGAVTPSTELTELALLLKKSPGKTVLLEMHGRDEENTDALAKTAAAWFVAQGVPPTQIVARGVGAKYPLLPTDGLGGDVGLNRRLEVRISR
jgi:hypothetical protein